MRVLKNLISDRAGNGYQWEKAGTTGYPCGKIKGCLVYTIYKINFRQTKELNVKDKIFIKLYNIFMTSAY